MPVGRRGVMGLIAGLVMGVAGVALPVLCLAQAQTGASASHKSTRPPALPLGLTARFAGMDWLSLSPVQQSSLKPLAATWNSLSDGHKRKWLSITANYPRMTQAEQAKLNERMAQWAALSPQMREHARLNFAEAKAIAPADKNEKWQAYQALSPEEKQKLASSAQPKPPATALASKPAPAGKLSIMPRKRLVTPVRPASGTVPAVTPIAPIAPIAPITPAASVASGVPVASSAPVSSVSPVLPASLVVPALPGVSDPVASRPTAP